MARIGRALAAAAAAAALAPATAAADLSNLPADLTRHSLSLDIHSGLLGLFRIGPRQPGPFPTLTRLDVAVVEHTVADPRQWLLDRVSAETATVAEAALILFDPDHPYAEAGIHDQERGAASVHATLSLMAEQPHRFCGEPSESYNAAGRRVEVDCAFRLGGTSSRLLMRVQEAGSSWYSVTVQAQNRHRYRQLSAIANSLRF